MDRPRYYVTTPIYYATDKPHIGHSYTTIAADTAARYRRLTGHDVFFLTGTDEHGQKMERQAAREGLAPRELADRTAPRYAELWERLHVRFDRFIRTTEPGHRAAVEEMWSRMTARGDIYKGEYEGRYCVGCEIFYMEKELVDGRCPDHGTVPELVKETGYFFRLSAYEQPLLEHYARNPGFVRPASRLNEVASFVRSGLRDLSISRGTTRWGIPVPGDESQVIYVWVDALTNYVSGIGFPADASRFERWWPADVHLVGKDILRFHAVYWPAFLLSAGLPLPRQVFAHGWWLRDERKISKSAGGMAPLEPLIERFGADAVRYFLLRENPFGNDGAYSDEAFVQRYNADLANDLGNLGQRTMQMIRRYAEGEIPPPAAAGPLPELAQSAVTAFRESFDELLFSRGIEAIWELVRTGNRHIDERAPWTLAKDAERRGELLEVLGNVAELVRLVATCLWPVMPERTSRMLASLGIARERDDVPSAGELGWGGAAPQRRLGGFQGLFPRVDEQKWLGTAEHPADAAPSPGEAGKAGTKPSARSAPAAAGPAGGELLSIDDFFRADLRVARVREAERVEKSKKLLKLQVDLGTETRQLVAGIAERYAPEDLVGKLVVVVANLKPARIMGVESQGMLLAATLDGKPVVATFELDVPPGTRVK